MSEGDDEGVVAEGVGFLVKFVGEGAIESEGDGLPLGIGSGDGDGAVAVVLAGLLEVGMLDGLWLWLWRCFFFDGGGEFSCLFVSGFKDETCHAGAGEFFAVS